MKDKIGHTPTDEDNFDMSLEWIRWLKNVSRIKTKYPF